MPPEPTPYYEASQLSALAKQFLAANEALLAKIASQHGAPRDMSINVEDYPLEEQKKAAGRDPVLRCPLCGHPVTYLQAAVPEKPLPSDADKAWSTMPAVVTRQRHFVYVLSCGCKVGEQWAAKFGKEVNQRVKGFPPQQLTFTATAVDVAIDRKQTIDDLTVLFKMRDETHNPIELKCIEIALLFLVARMMAMASVKNKTVHDNQKPAVGNDVAVWAMQNGLAHTICNPPSKAPEHTSTSDWDNANAYAGMKLPQLGKQAIDNKPQWKVPLGEKITHPDFPKGAAVYMESAGTYVVEMPGQVNRTFPSITAARDYLMVVQKVVSDQQRLKMLNELNNLSNKSHIPKIFWEDKIPQHSVNHDAAIALAEQILHTPKPKGVKPVPAPGPNQPQFGSSPGIESTPKPADPKSLKDAFFNGYKRKKRRIQPEE